MNLALCDENPGIKAQFSHFCFEIFSLKEDPEHVTM